MRQICYYNPADRQKEKELQRASDAARLQSGSVSREELRAQNGFFSSLEIVESAVICQEVFA